MRKSRVVILLSLLLVLAVLPRTTSAGEADTDDLKSVWERVHRSGSYEFSADITQTTTTPDRAIKIGPSTQKTRLHMEGKSDLAAKELDLTLWNGGGSVLLPETGIQIKIADGQASARRSDGVWEPIDDFSSSMAPDGDFLVMLSVADNVVRHAPEVRTTILGEVTVTRFVFDINGPRFAEYMRDLTARQLTDRGELPPGLQLDLPEIYARMTGRGELLVGEDGLPISQVFELNFPEGNYGSETGQAVVRTEVTFSNFGSPEPGAAANLQSNTIGGMIASKNVPGLFIALVLILLVVIAAQRSRSKAVYAAVALTVSFSMLVSPLLSSSQVAAFGKRQAEKQADQEDRQAEADAAQAWQDALANPAFDPHSNPLEAAKTNQAISAAVQAQANSLAASGVISATGDSSAYFDSSCETNPGDDNDGDNLTNLEECLIGTLPGAIDSDQDGVDDGLEVNGFAYDDNSSVIWYTNPLYPDTNRDGLGDGNEWYMDADNDGKPDDTDLDGIPDLWDDDNDGDGVPDDLDLSPYNTTLNTNVFNDDAPMQLIVDDLGEGLITKVEFQLTPTDPNHLWYTNNVLDWADNDRQGQMQDADGLSFYDVDNTVDPWPNDLGDVRLVPMLEIEMTSTSNNFNLPDDQTLQKFGITVHDTSADTKTAYVPVSLVTDNTGNKNVAFHGAMYYQADSSWGNAHTVRLVWLVQALVDVCKTYENGICDTYSEYNNLQVIHSYDEEWVLTGMEISEERGTNIAAIYEDPAETADAPLYMDTLFPFVYGLDRTFMAGADCEVTDENDNCVSGNGQFDLTVSGIYTRFNHTTNDSVPDVERWSLPDVLSVQTNSYPAIELAMLDTVVTQTTDILTDTFTSAWSASNPITPTIMYAWEHNYRVVSLGNAHLSWSGNILTADVASSGTDPVQVEQENGMKWAPYAYNTSDGWFAADFDNYWSELDVLLPGFFSGDADVDAEVASAEFLYLGMYTGETNLVQYGDLLTSKNYQAADLPIQLEVTSLVGSGLKKGVAMYYGSVSDIRDAFKLMKNEASESLSALEKAGLSIRNTVQSYISLLEESVGAIGIGLIMLTSYAALIVAGIYLYRKYVAHDNISKGLFIATAVALSTLAFIVGVIKPVLNIIKTINGLIEVGAAATKIEAIGALFEGEGAPSVEYNILGLVISIGISVAFFVTLLASGQIKSGSIAAQSLAAQTIAAILEAMIIFILNLNPFTAILVGIAALIDVILFALGVNFSITGKLTQAIADALYEFDLSVDTAVDTGSIATELVNPGNGLVAGNQMIFTMPITTVITQSNKVDISEDAFRTNSFVYDLAALDAYQSGLATTYGDRANEWSVIHSSALGYIGTVSDTVSYKATLFAGVNRSFIFYLDSAYDLLGESCWWISGCKDKYVAGSDSSEIGSSLVFDIYPATVEEFVDVTAWSTGNLRIADADGDGLLPLGAGGVDPDDTAWDADGDQLSDDFELSMRGLTEEEGGEILDPMLMDTDGDGIPDNEELWLATNPDNADSDGDGLPDIDEAARADADLRTLNGGWLFPYSLNDLTRVWSDPNSADYDGDGMSDLFESTQDTCPDCTPWADPNNPLLFSPYVYNENPVPLYLDDNTNDGFVTPGTNFVYSTTTENNLSEGILLAGEVALSLPDIFTGAPLTAEVALNSGYSETLASELSPAVSGSASGVLTSSMDLAALEDVIWSWDPAGTNSTSPVGGDIKALDATAAPGFSDLYVYTALELDGAGTQYITVYTAGNDGNPSDSKVLSSIGSSAGITYSAPSVACNDNGVCVVVWGEPDYPNGGIINGFILNGSLGQASLLSSIKPSEYDSITLAAPSIATDGDNFMVGWTQDTGSQASTWVRQVYADGTLSSRTQVWQIGNHGSNPIGLVWTGSSYLAVWINIYDATMYRAEIDASMNVGPVTMVYDDAESFPNANGADRPLSLSYDRLSNQALVIYRDLAQHPVSGYYMSARRLTAAGSSSAFDLDLSEQGISTASYYADIDICADPQNGGWLVAWSRNGFQPSDPNVHYRAIAPDGSLRGGEQLVGTTNDNPAVAIACRAPHPLLELEFEEASTAAIYADSSQYGHDAVCDLSGGTCPIGGAQGRFGNGVLFDGINDRLTSSFTQPVDDFTIEFWLNTNCQDCDILNTLGGTTSLYLQNGEICVRAASSSGSGVECSGSGDNFADGEWHHIFYVDDGQAQHLYMDGDIQVYTSFNFTAINCSSNCDQFVLGTAGNNFFSGTLDEVRFHDRALSSAEALQAFLSAVTILDMDETAGATTAYDATHSGFNGTCSGTSCPTFGVDGVANTSVQFDGSNDYLLIEGQNQTLASYVYDFESSDTSGWSNTTISSATREGATTDYLGNFGNQDVTLSLNNLPTHDTLTIAFDLYVIGDWDGNRTDTGPDSWQWGYDNTTVLQATFSNQADTSPNYQSYPAWYDTANNGITLYENSDLSGDRETFFSDDPDLSDNLIGSNRASAYAPSVKTVAILYDGTNYSGSSWIMDPNRGNVNVPTNDVVSSLHVFSGLHSPEYDATGDSLSVSGFSETAVYHIEYTLDAHTASSLSLFFEGLASDGGQERWGLDNVVVEAQSNGGSIPLTNNSFTLSAWARRDSSGTSDYIISQGSAATNLGVYFGFEGNSLVCSIWGHKATYSVPYDGAWHHVACTFFAPSILEDMYLYYDGAQVASLAVGADYGGFGDTYIGKRFDNNGPFDGSLDEVAIWIHPLNDDQILELYQKVRVEDQAVLHGLIPVQEDSSLITLDILLRETASTAGTEAQVVTRTLGIDADSPSTTILAPTADAYVTGLQALEVSGAASDPTSYVTNVEVQTDGGSWTAASGTESWSYTIPAGTLGDGLHTVSARATDVVGSTGTASSVEFIVDDTPPDIGFDSGGTALPIRDEDGRWIVLSITGQAGDPPAGTQPGSGLVSVEVLMQGGSNLVGNGWQTATLQSGGFWSVDYVLPEVGTGGVEVGNPTGSYTILVRATDAVGNTTPEGEYASGPLALETNPPVPTLVTALPLTQAITTSLTITGYVLDDWPVAAVDIGFTPGSNIGALGEAVLHLPFDDTYTHGRYFSDRSGSNNPAGCSQDVCPQSGQAGQRDQALEFDGLTQHAFIADDDSIDFSTDDDFTVAVWVYADPDQPSTGNADNDIVEKWSGGGIGYPYVLRHLNQTGHVQVGRYDGHNHPTIESTVVITDGLFHHVAFVKSGDTLSLYIDGALDGTTADTTTGNTTNSSALYLGMRGNNTNHFKGLLDELVIHDRALADYEIADLYEYGLTTWYNATVDNSGPVATWSFTIPEGAGGLEGIFQINVRATDDLGYSTPYENQRVWRGEIDTLAPRVTYTAINTVTVFPSVTYRTNYKCTATDFNLVADDTCLVQPPDTSPVFNNPASTDYSAVDLWYADVISDTGRLYKFVGSQTINGTNPTNQSLQTCDAYGRCTVVTNSLESIPASTKMAESGDLVAPAATLLQDLSIDAGILTPTTGIVLTDTTPLTITGFALAENGLQSLSVTANQVEVYNDNWPVSPTITNTLWSFAWAPPGEGVYLFETQVADWLSTTATGSLTATLYVDTGAPSIEINPTVLTTTHQSGDQAVRLTGAAFDSLQVQRVDVSLEGGAWQRAGLAADGSWQWLWPLAGQPDGETFSVSARATDLAGRTALDTQSVLVDLVPPQTVTVTLAYQNAGGQTLPISAGDTLTDALSLQASWTASSDGSGISGYHVGWSQSPTPVLAELASYPGAGSHTQPVGEAEIWYAHVLVVDGAGNSASQTLGPVYVDGQLTPDITGDIGYHGWINLPCTLAGVDRRLSQAHPVLYGDRQQRFYATWDEAALRLLWQGANWNHDGDLFIYLDTRPGGSDRLYNPYPDDPDTIIYLPGNLPDPAPAAGQRQKDARASLTPEAIQSAIGADYMVWVESSDQASLYRWDGTAWTLQGTLESDQFLLNPGVASSDTELRLPFADLGIADPSIAALGLLAVATEEDALQLWSSMPVRNPLNSDRVVNPIAALVDQHTFPLVRGYYWDGLGNGLCANGRLNGDGRGPTGGAFADSDLQLTLTANPVGTTYSFHDDEMAWLWSLLFGFEAAPLVPSQLFTHMDTEHPLLGAGQLITYTIDYANLGTEAATGVKIDLDAWYSLKLAGNSTVDLGDIPPGATGSVQISGYIDPSGVNPAEQEWAALDAYVFDDQYPENAAGGSWSSAPLEWLWSDHRVDVQPPSAASIDMPEFVIPAGAVTLRGQVVDESPVSLIMLEVLDEDGVVETIACPDDTPTDGKWACPWDAGNAGDGDIFQIRAQAIDHFGQTGEWTPWSTLEVDATPPRISLDNEQFSFGPGIHHLSGGFTDERQIGSVVVCREDGECSVHIVDPRPEIPEGALAQTGVWSAYLLPPPDLRVDGQAQTLTVYGQDAAGNRSEGLTVTYRMDDSPPVLSVDYVAASVPVISANLIASGTVSDGSPVDINVLVDPPAGLRQRLKASVNDNEWSFTHAWTSVGVYTLWVQAIDASGNKTTVGPYSILVGDATGVYFPTIYKDGVITPNASRVYLPYVGKTPSP